MKTITLIALLGLALPALADRLPLPPDTPASFKDECGSCHIAYQPALLAAGDWRRIMAGLNEHFSSDATVSPKNWPKIKSFLESHAGSADRLGSAGNPPRITQTQRFIRKHHEVPTKFWRDPRVKSAANCEACHRGAASGNYGEHDIAIPELRE
jgi:nitrate/TMAO reductase-like tetraheme cytochrome c subunit